MANFIKLSIPAANPTIESGRAPKAIWINLDQVVKIDHYAGAGDLKSNLYAMIDGKVGVFVSVIEAPEQILSHLVF